MSTARVIGARQLVVQLALETILCSAERMSWLTPTTTVSVSSLHGAETITRLAPPSRWAPAFSVVR